MAGQTRLRHLGGELSHLLRTVEDIEIGMLQYDSIV